MIITIDGPAGAGKSSAARGLAAQLGFRFLDTGAMYRAVTWAVLDRGISPEDESAVGVLAEQLALEIVGERVLVDGRDITEAIRDPHITRHISSIADNPQVRARLSRLQRAVAERGNFICEGRDQGTVVFPDAPCKFFLTASPEARARRRQRELAEQGIEVSFDELVAQQNERDHRDKTRAVGRLEPARDAIQVVTDDLNLDQVVTLLLTYVRKRIAEMNK